MADKMRVHILAKELNVSSKAILAKCAAEGVPVKNHMTALGPGLEATIREWFTEGAHTTTIETAERVNLKKVRIRRRRKKAAEHVETTEDGVTTAVEEPREATPPPAEAAPHGPEPTPEPEAEPEPQPAETPVEEAPAAEAPAPQQEEQPPAETPAVVTTEAPAEEVPPAEPQAPAEPAVPERAAAEAQPAPETVAPVEETAPPPPQEATPPTVPEPDEEPSPAEPLKPAGPQNVPAPAKLQGPRVVRYEAPESYPPPRPARRKPQGPPGEPEPAPPSDKPGDKRRGDAAARKRKTSSPRRAIRSDDWGAQERLREWRDQDLIERRERLHHATGRKIQRRRKMDVDPQQITHERKTKVQIQEPIRVREFCSAVGVPFIKLLKTLQRDHGQIVNINSVLPTDIAELIALDEGVEVEIVKAKTQYDELREEFEQRTWQKPKSRPPVVTFLGHVDHGKTSLLDRIRATGVAQGEDGGITQHIGSYHLKRKSSPLTFLDTPGHEAFTAMRARGAQMTDVIILIVAADDGVMPQTVEAINHAKAAGVPIVVAITKMDLGVFNQAKVYGQLAEHGLTPSGDWGGETDVIHTSAVSGEGIDNLLDHLAALAELLDLKADYAGDATGTVIEAETREGVGSAVRVLVQQGKLKPGAFVVCGNAYGRVRAIIDDQGKRLKEAGPSIPCEIWGLDEVPSAGDRFFAVKNLQRAKSIAEEIRQQRADQARAGTQKVRTLEEMFKQRDVEDTPELNIIIRADVDGSLDALRHSLGQLPSDEVRLNIQHAAVGQVTDGDVLLGDASDAIIVAFRVGVGTGPRKLAEESGVDVREYKVIYDVIDDISKALEGLLAPEERIENRATLEVRDTFKVTKVGTVAGCYVTDGVIARSHKVRLLRDGNIIRDDCEIASLRRFKDDVKEVRNGMECGVRLAGFDDVKRGDILEAYEVVKVARTL